MRERTVLFGLASGWAALWIGMGLLRVLGFPVPLVGLDPGVTRSPALASLGFPGFGPPAVDIVLRLLGALQIAVGILFVLSLVPGRRTACDRTLGACAYALILLGLMTAVESMADHVAGIALNGALFVGISATALFCGTRDHRAMKGEDRLVFTWAQREALLDDTVERLARRKRLPDYPSPCRTSSQTSQGSGWETPTRPATPAA